MRKSIVFIKSLILFILIMPLFSNVYASVGKIAALRGKAVSFNNQASNQLTINSEIFLNDRVETEKNSRLQILFKDETIASMGPESIMIVKNFKWENDEQRFEAEAKEGLFHIMGGKIVNTAPKNFKIKTPVASIGIRGSIFAFKVEKNNLNIVFLGGKGIDITTSFGSTALVKPGFGTNISGDTKQIETPRKFTEKEIAEFKYTAEASEITAPLSKQSLDIYQPIETKTPQLAIDDRNLVSQPNQIGFTEIASDKNQKNTADKFIEEQPGEIKKLNGFVAGIIESQMDNEVYFEEVAEELSIDFDEKNNTISGNIDNPSITDSKFNFEGKNEYLTWGNWEASYNHEGYGEETHTPNPAKGFFIAGQPTENIETVMGELKNKGTTLNYEGTTNTILIENFNEKAILPRGSFLMNVDPDNLKIKAEIKPTNDLTFKYEGQIKESRINASKILDASSNNSFHGNLNGSFFGPNAEAVGGNFNAEHSTGRYIGTFQGKR